MVGSHDYISELRAVMVKNLVKRISSLALISLGLVQCCSCILSAEIVSLGVVGIVIASPEIGYAKDDSVESADSAEGPTTEHKKIKQHKQTVKEILAKDDPRGPPELTLCSQNLNNLGDYALTKQRLDNSMSIATYNAKVAGLAKRMIKGGCDVIAVQELLGTTEDAAIQNLRRIADVLHYQTGRVFDVIVGNTNDPISRVGYLLASDRVELLAQVSYNRVELPKILPKERPRYFLRGPLEIQLSVRGREGSKSKIFTVVNFHLKSKGGRERDPAELEWETYRMQMAEAVRRIVESRHERSFASGETLLALVGDRNSNFDSASNEILSGSLTLDDFKLKGGCRLSKRGVAFCQKDKHRPHRLFSLLQGDPQTSVLTGTFHMRNVYSWLDEILVPQETMRFAWENYAEEGDYTSFVIAEPPDVSDHALVGAVFNW